MRFWILIFTPPFFYFLESVKIFNWLQEEIKASKEISFFGNRSKNENCFESKWANYEGLANFSPSSQRGDFKTNSSKPQPNFKNHKKEKISKILKNTKTTKGNTKTKED